MQVKGLSDIISDDNVIKTGNVTLIVDFSYKDNLHYMDVKLLDYMGNIIEKNSGAATSFDAAVAIIAHKYVHQVLYLWKGATYKVKYKRLTLTGERFARVVDTDIEDIELPFSVDEDGDS